MSVYISVSGVLQFLSFSPSLSVNMPEARRKYAPSYSEAIISLFKLGDNKHSRRFYGFSCQFCKFINLIFPSFYKYQHKSPFRGFRSLLFSLFFQKTISIAYNLGNIHPLTLYPLINFILLCFLFHKFRFFLL